MSILSFEVRNSLRQICIALHAERSLPAPRKRQHFSRLLRGEPALNLREEISQAAFEQAEHAISEAGAEGVTVLSPFDEEYPKSLLHAHAPPYFLYRRGATLCATAPAIALVGSRHPSHYGKSVAFQLALDLAARGAKIVSGLAYGIDTEAHRGAIRSGTYPGVAVLGSGVLAPYPRENRKLCDELLAAGGTVLSEYGLTQPPQKHHFPERNRIVSGISSGVIVVEAGERSGALITARLAAEQGKEVLAVPGLIDSALATGTNRLIQQGAHLITCARDVWDVLVGVQSDPIAGNVPVNAETRSDEIEAAIVAYLRHETRGDVDRLAQYLNFPVPKILAAISRLELDGVIIRADADELALAHAR